MAAEVLGRGVQDDVGAELDGVEQVRRRDRVVDDERHTGRVRDRGDLLDVEDVGARVRDRLREEQLGVRADRVAPGLRVVRVADERRLDAQLGERVVEQVVRAAVEARARDDVVAGLRDVEDREGRRGLAGRDEQCADPALERRDPRVRCVVILLDRNGLSSRGDRLRDAHPRRHFPLPRRTRPEPQQRARMPLDLGHQRIVGRREIGRHTHRHPRAGAVLNPDRTSGTALTRRKRPV